MHSGTLPGWCGKRTTTSNLTASDLLRASIISSKNVKPCCLGRFVAHRMLCGSDSWHAPMQTDLCRANRASTSVLFMHGAYKGFNTKGAFAGLRVCSIAGIRHSRPTGNLVHCMPRLSAKKMQAHFAAKASLGDSVGSSVPGLLATCVLMFAGAYVCGMLPSWLPVTRQRLASVNALGAGLLLGSALVIILPEGFEAAMDAAHETGGMPEWSTSLSLLAGFWFMLLLDSLSTMLPGPSTSRANPHLSADSPEFESVATSAPLDVSYDEENAILLSDIQHSNNRESNVKNSCAPRNSTVTSEHDSVVAATAKDSTASPLRRGTRLSTTAADTSHLANSSTADGGEIRSGFSTDARSAIATAPGTEQAASQLWGAWLKEPAQQALLGLIVHAASDGLAVGAASLATKPAVSLSVATAMVVHKGPVAVGLATYLRSANWQPDRVHKGILLFSAASPAAALLTYWVLSTLPALSDGSKVPLAILFSGGSVLYAATMHILPSVMVGHGHHGHGISKNFTMAVPSAESSPTYARNQAAQQQLPAAQQNPSDWQLLLVTAGMLLPLVLSSLFPHDHGH